MPSYRYTRDIKPEDLQPEQATELAGKEKRKNWWHYHWKLVLIIALAAVLLGSFVVEIVRKDNPDMKVVLMSSKSLPDAVTELLAERLGELVGDVNGDGKALVEITICTVSPFAEEGEQADTDTMEDPYSQMAGVTRLSAAMADEEVMLYIVETDLVQAYQQSYGILGYLDGTAPAEGATDYENMVLEWADSPVLTGLDMDMEYDGGVFDAGEYMSFFSVGVRKVANTQLDGKDAAWENQALALELVNGWQ